MRQLPNEEGVTGDFRGFSEAREERREGAGREDEKKMSLLERHAIVKEMCMC